MILCGDALEMLKTLPDGCVHLTVTSPPYDNLRTYDGHNEWDFKSIAKELYRVTCQGGVVCWNVGDSVVDGGETLNAFRQALYFVDTVGFRMHDTMIWRKPNFANPERVRYHQIFEYVFILSRESPRTFNPILDKENKYGVCWGNNTGRDKN